MKKQSNNQSTEYRNTGIPDTGKSAIKQSGFSLVELMISLGILVVGLAMVATAFPSAMLETKLSVADTSATMISENAAAICRTKLKHSVINSLVGATLSEQTTQINNPAHTGDLTYPVNTLDSRYGWLLALRNIRPTGWVAGNPIPNDYQLVIVPYRKFLPGDLPPTFSDVTTDGSKITGVGDIISIGSPVISTSNGTFAYVVDSAGNLSGPITSGAALTVGAVGQDSPAIGCYVVRTAVAP